MTASLYAASPLRPSPLALRRAASPRAAMQDRARRRPAASRPGWCASRSVPLVALAFAFDGRRQRRIPPTSRASPRWSARCSTRAPATSMPTPSRNGWRSKPIELGFTAGPRPVPRLAAHARRASRRGVRAAAPRADRAALRRRGGRAHARADPSRAARARPRSRTSIANRRWWRDGVSGSSLRPADQRHAESVAAITRRRSAAPTSRRSSRATRSRSPSSATSMPTRLGELIDRVFGALPATARSRRCPTRRSRGLRRAHRGRSRRAADGDPLRRRRPRAQAIRISCRPMCVNHILGGGSFTSRLYRRCARSAASPTASAPAC